MPNEVTGGAKKIFHEIQKEETKPNVEELKSVPQNGFKEESRS